MKKMILAKSWVFLYSAMLSFPLLATKPHSLHKRGRGSGHTRAIPQVPTQRAVAVPAADAGPGASDPEVLSPFEINEQNSQEWATILHQDHPAIEAASAVRWVRLFDPEGKEEETARAFRAI